MKAVADLPAPRTNVGKRSVDIARMTRNCRKVSNKLQYDPVARLVPRPSMLDEHWQKQHVCKIAAIDLCKREADSCKVVSEVEAILLSLCLLVTKTRTEVWLGPTSCCEPMLIVTGLFNGQALNQRGQNGLFRHLGNPAW